jgi:hypothetical protein
MSVYQWNGLQGEQGGVVGNILSWGANKPMRFGLDGAMGLEF